MVYELDRRYNVFSLCQGHTHIHIVLQDECFEVFGCQPWSFPPLLLMLLVFWQFFGGLVCYGSFSAGAFSSELPKESSRKLKTRAHTHAHTGGSGGSLSLFKVPKRKKGKQKESVCVCDPKPDF